MVTHLYGPCGVWNFILPLITEFDLQHCTAGMASKYCQFRWMRCRISPVCAILEIRNFQVRAIGILPSSGSLLSLVIHGESSFFECSWNYLFVRYLFFFGGSKPSKSHKMWNSNWTVYDLVIAKLFKTAPQQRAICI